MRGMMPRIHRRNRVTCRRPSESRRFASIAAMRITNALNRKAEAARRQVLGDI
jgi:hypothetical protein